MGVINLVPVFGTSFNNFFPITLVVLCLFHALNLYARILNMLGLKKFVFEQNYSDDRIDDGRAIAGKSNTFIHEFYKSFSTNNLVKDRRRSSVRSKSLGKGKLDISFVSI